MTDTVRFRTGPLVRAAGIAALGLAVVACGSAAAAGSSATATPSGGGGFRGNGNFAEGTVGAGERHHPHPGQYLRHG